MSFMMDTLSQNFIKLQNLTNINHSMMSQKSLNKSLQININNIFSQWIQIMENNQYEITTAKYEDLKFYYQYGLIEMQHGYDIYYDLQPNNFLIGKLNGQIISKIFWIEYSKDLVYLGGYFVKKQYRRRGYGILLFKKAMQIIKKFTIITINALQQQKQNFSKMWGFQQKYRLNQRCIEKIPQIDSNRNTIVIKKFQQINFQQLHKFDKLHFPHNRQKLLTQMFKKTRPFVSLDKITGQVLGYCCLCKFLNHNYFVNIMIAVSNNVAQDLIKQVIVAYRQSLQKNAQKIEQTLLTIYTPEKQQDIEIFLDRWFPKKLDQIGYKMFLGKNDGGKQYLSHTYSTSRY